MIKAKGKLKKPLAKGKQKAQRIADDETALKEFEKKIEVRKNDSVTKTAMQQGKAVHGGVTTGELVNVIADELEEIYQVFGTKIDRINAKDKALILVREILYQGGGSKVQEQEFDLRYCKKHREKS